MTFLLPPSIEGLTTKKWKLYLLLTRRAVKNPASQKLTRKTREQRQFWMEKFIEDAIYLSNKVSLSNITDYHTMVIFMKLSMVDMRTFSLNFSYKIYKRVVTKLKNKFLKISLTKNCKQGKLEINSSGNKYSYFYLNFLLANTLIWLK